MARQWRIEYEGAFYHVMSRGNEGRDIFFDDEDRELFLNLMGEMSDRFEIEIHAWVLMSNHYHLLLRTRKANLSKSMQWLGATYTRRYNVKHKRRGHLYQGRFKSILVEDGQYMFRLSCYIHRNPLRATMVKRLADYKWSSYRRYAYGAIGLDWLETNLILSQVNGKDLNLAYRLKVQQYAEEEKKIAEDIQLGLVIGTKKFAQYIKNKFRPEHANEEIPLQRRTNKEYDIIDLLNSASQLLGCDVDLFKKAGRISQKDKMNRDLLLYLLWKTGAFSNKEIGSCLGMTYSGVSRRIGIRIKNLKKDKEFQGQFNRIKSLIKM